MFKKYLLILSSLLLAPHLTILAEENQSDQSQDLIEAQDSISQPELDWAEKHGLSYTINKDSLDLIMDESKLLESIPNLQGMGVLNPDITQTSINLSPDFFAITTGIYLTPFVIMKLYDDGKIDKIHIKTYMMVTNDYGNSEKKFLYSFDFSKNLYNKINWDNFKAPKLLEVAPNLKTSSWFSEVMQNAIYQ